MRNSPTLPSALSPKESEATVLVMFIEFRWSMIAFAAPSRSVETTNASSFSASPGAASALTKVKSCVAVAPAATVTVALASR